MTVISKIARSRVGLQKTLKYVKTSSFHSAPIRMAPEEEEKKVTAVEAAAPAAPSIFSDPLVAVPIGLACAIPALSNNIYVLNEESQLACCFALFCTSVYKFGGDAISSYFDSKSAAILQEHNEIEDANIAMAKETLQVYKDQLNVLDDVNAINSIHQEVLARTCVVASDKMKHQMRDIFQKNLEGVYEVQRMYEGKVQEKMVEYAYKNVCTDIAKGGKSVKDAAFKNALNVLSGVEEKKDYVDPVSSLYVKYVQKYAKSIQAQDGTTVELTPEEQSELQASLDAYMKRYFEDAGFTAPTKVQL